MLQELIDLWWDQAEKHQVLPLQGTVAQRYGFPRPQTTAPRDRYVYFPGSPVPFLSQPLIYNRSHSIEVEINVPSGGAEGVIVASGAHTGGYSLFIKDGSLHYVYNYLGRKMFRIDTPQAVPEGDVKVAYEFEVTGEPDIRAGNGAPGIGRLFLNGEPAGEVVMDVTVPLLFSAEGMSIGYDYGDSVDHENYGPPFRFTGTVNSVVFDLSGDATIDDEAEARHTMSKQ
jgi:arylsulfatase